MNRLLQIAVLMIFQFLPGFVSAQAEPDSSLLGKKALLPKDYNLWESLASPIISPDGKWVMCGTVKNGVYNFHLKNMANDLEYKLNTNTYGQFSDTSEWYAYVSFSDVILINLKYQNKIVIKDASDYKFAMYGKVIIVRNRDSMLRIIDLKNSKTDSIEHVSSVLIDPSTEVLALISNKSGIQSISTVYLHRPKHIERVCITPGAYSQLSWNKSGNSLAFLETRNSRGGKEDIWFHFYSMENHRHFSSKYQNKGLAVAPNKPLKISADNRSVYFSTKLVVPNSKEQVGVSHSQAGPLNLENQLAKDQYCLSRWIIEDDKYDQLISKTDLSLVAQKFSDSFILIFDQRPYVMEDQEFYDVYLLDLNSGGRKLVIKKQSYPDQTLQISPSGKYVAFFKQKQWWLYDVKNEKQVNLTENIKTSFNNADHDYPYQPTPYGIIGWDKSEQLIYCYDQFDMWELCIHTREGKRLTLGREKKLTYSLLDLQSGIKRRNQKNMDDIGSQLELSFLVFQTTDERTNSTGYCFKYKGKEIVSIVNPNEGKNSGLRKAKYANTYVYINESFSKSPTLYHTMADKKSPRLILETNKQQRQYFWGKSEIITYRNAEGKLLKAGLFYPANYIIGKKYPMIVEIYENTSQNVNTYTNPSIKSTFWINNTNYTQDGYFVLNPDITYKVDSVGQSATDCVVSAVNAVIFKGIIDDQRIGLTGHSFGGYETNYIITQTNIFRTATSKAGISDITTVSLSDKIGGWAGKQGRLTGKWHNNMDVYRANSPLYQVSKITTPLLIAVGGEDRADYNQALVFYNALVSLNKTAVLLRYKHEGHSLNNEKDQIDFCIRQKQWFDYYLKGEHPAPWILNMND